MKVCFLFFSFPQCGIPKNATNSKSRTEQIFPAGLPERASDAVLLGGPSSGLHATVHVA